MPLDITWPQDRRRDKWTLEEQPVLREETLVVPSSAPYEVELSEIPKKDSMIVRAGSSGISLQPTGDSYIDEANTGVNHSTETILAAGRNSADGSSTIVRSLLQFDLSTGPSSASSVILWLYRAVLSAAPLYGLHRITGSWTPNAVTWANQPAFDLVPASTFQTIANQAGWYAVNLTALYNKWKDGTYPNYGLMLRTGEAQTGTSNNFYSVEGPSDKRPHIDIVGVGDLYEVVDASVAPAAGQVAVNYLFGRLRFHSSAAGLTTTPRYLGLGSLVGAERLFANAIPSGSSSPGRPGQTAADANYFYVCVATNTWRRVAISTF